MESDSCIVENAGHFVNVKIDELPTQVASGQIPADAIIWVGNRCFSVSQAVDLAKRGKLGAVEQQGDGYDRGTENYDRGATVALFLRLAYRAMWVFAIILILNVAFPHSVTRLVSRMIHSVSSSSSEEQPADETPTDETPTDETPADETPAGETPADETPADETPADETPADETPADETSVDETPANRRSANEKSVSNFGALPLPDGYKPSNRRSAAEKSSSNFGILPLPDDSKAAGDVPDDKPHDEHTLGSDENAGAPVKETDSLTPPAQRTGAERPTASVRFALAPFDPSVTRIDPEYVGHDLKAVVDSLNRPLFAMPDPTFESSVASYRRSLRNLYETVRTENLVGTTTFDSRLAYVVPNVSEEDDRSEFVSDNFYSREYVKCGYRAKDKTMIVQLANRLNYRYEWDRGAFAPTSAAVAPLFVSRKDDETYALTIDLRKNALQNFGAWFFVGVDSEDFARVRNSIRVLCVFSLGASGNGALGLFAKDVTGGEYNELYATDAEFWIYNGETGEIYAKYTALESCRGVKKAFDKSENVSDAVAANRSGEEESDAEVAKERGQESKETPPQSPAAGARTEKPATAKRAWNDAYNEVRDVLEDWETREADVTIPDDCKTLVEAVNACPPGGVIRVKSTPESPVKLGYVRDPLDEHPGLELSGPITIVGSPADPSSAVIEIGRDEGVWIVSSEAVRIGGVTFRYAYQEYKSARPLASVVEGGVATFRDCVFTDVKAGREASFVVVDGEYASATLQKCAFSRCEADCVRFVNGSTGAVEFCRFGPDVMHGVASLDGARATISHSLFLENAIGVTASGGGGFTLSDSFFSDVSLSWVFSSGSREFCDTKENNFVERSQSQSSDRKNKP